MPASTVAASFFSASSTRALTNAVAAIAYLLCSECICSPSELQSRPLLNLENELLRGRYLTAIGRAPVLHHRGLDGGVEHARS